MKYLLFVLLLFLACSNAESPTGAPPPQATGPITGTYDGTYTVINGYNTQSADTSFSTIELRFSDVSYWFDSDNSPDIFCSPRGQYFLNNTIGFAETNEGCNVVANSSDNPSDEFSYRRPGDSLILLQQKVDKFKQILLLKRTQ